jgi:ABC-type uncharacterized transport system auxiliary subunit
MNRLVIAIACAAALVSCAPNKENNDDVSTAVAVYRGVNASPDKTDSVLKAHGLTEAGYDSLMYRIASDSTMRAKYADARK